MEEKVLNEIKELCNKFTKTKNYYEQKEIVSLIGYLKDIMPKNKVIADSFKKICKNIASFELTKYLLENKEDTEQFINDNYCYFDQYVEEASKNNAFNPEEIVCLTKDEINNTIEDFLLKTDLELYHFYLKMQEEGRIINGDVNRTFFTTTDNSNIVIIVPVMHNYIDIMNFIHQLGYAYYYFINNYKMADMENIKRQIKEEIAAKVLDVKFIKYLSNNDEYDQANVVKNFYDYNCYRADQFRERFNNLKTVIASQIAATTKDSDINIAFYYLVLANDDILDLIKVTYEDNKKRKILVK